MKLEREVTIVRIPSWYRIMLYGSLAGFVLATVLAVVFIGWWGLFVLGLSPLLLFARLVRFETRRVTIRIDDSLSITESKRVVAIPFANVSLRERRRPPMLEIVFPYRGASWRGIVARKDENTAVHDDPALYARIRATLRS